jgi:prepilin-type processing-associated H-X9-DG protein
MISFRCDCGKTLQARDEHAGRTTRCPECGQDVRIPHANEGFAPASAQPASRRRRHEDDEEVGETDSGYGPERTSGKAIASLILGIASFLCYIFTAVPAIILAILGLRDINRSRGRLGGQGLAIGGLITSGLSLVLMIPIGLILIGLLLPAVQKVREAANRLKSAENLKQLAMAMHSYHDSYGCFPPTVIYSKRDGKPLYSWRVALLPHLAGYDDLYKQFNLEEPWDSPHNKPLLDRMPAVFSSTNRQARTPGGTFYQVFVGKGALFEDKKRIRMADVTDGTANTFMIVEAANEVPWTSPQDLVYVSQAPLLPLLCGPSDRGFNACFADGSVRFISKAVSDQTLHKAITRNGFEVFNPAQDLPSQ